MGTAEDVTELAGLETRADEGGTDESGMDEMRTAEVKTEDISKEESDTESSDKSEDESELPLISSLPVGFGLEAQDAPTIPIIGRIIMIHIPRRTLLKLCFIIICNARNLDTSFLRSFLLSNSKLSITQNRVYGNFRYEAIDQPFRLPGIRK
jgi:hypothetical protein